MPEHHTRQVTTDKLEEAISHLSVGHTNLNTKVESIHTSLTAKIDSLIERFASISVPPYSPSSSPIPPPTPAHRHHMKLNVPRFDGIDPLGWIFKISQFFDYQGIPDHERLTVASLYGRPGVVLVSVDVQEWLLSFMADNASSVGVAICAVILRRSARSIVQASASRHHERISHRFWETREQDDRPSSFMFVELLCVRTDIGAPPRSLGPPPVILTPGDWARTVIGRQNVGSPPW